MTYKGLFLTKKESKDAMCLGYAYAYEKKDRWETINVPSTDIGEYDFGTTFLVKENVVYTIHKDYIIMDENIRLYILKRIDRSTDTIPEDEPVTELITGDDPGTESGD